LAVSNQQKVPARLDSASAASPEGVLQDQIVVLLGRASLRPATSSLHHSHQSNPHDCRVPAPGIAESQYGAIPLCDDDGGDWLPGAHRKKRLNSFRG